MLEQVVVLSVFLIIAWVAAFVTAENAAVDRKRELLDALEAYFSGIYSFAIANKTIRHRHSVLRRLFPRAELLNELSGISDGIKNWYCQMRNGTSDYLHYGSSCSGPMSELRIDASDRAQGEFFISVRDDETGVRLPATTAFYEKYGKRQRQDDIPPNEAA